MKEYEELELDRKMKLLTDNADGQEDSGMEVFSADGVEDTSIDNFGGSGIPSNMLSIEKRFSFSITNSTDYEQAVAITPGLNKTIRMAVVDANGKYKANGGGLVDAPVGKVTGDVVIEYTSVEDIVKTGTRVSAIIDDCNAIYAEVADPAKKISAQSGDANHTIREFLEYIDSNPTLFLGLFVSSPSNPMAYQKTFTYKRTSPLSKNNEETISFNSGNLPINPNSTQIIVEKKFQLDSDTLSHVMVPANTSVTYIFVAGFAQSSGTALRNKTELIRKGKQSVTMVKLVKPRIKK